MSVSPYTGYRWDPDARWWDPVKTFDCLGEAVRWFNYQGSLPTVTIARPDDLLPTAPLEAE